MKNLLFIFTLMLVSNSWALDTDQHQKVCESLSVFAKSAMNARQRGIDKERILQLIDNDKEPAKRLEEAIIHEVFRHPKQFQDELLDSTAEQYAKHYYQICMSK